MSPVHVVVGQDPRAEAKWLGAFAGAIDLYSFPRNVDAFERLTAAQAPIDLVIITPAQDGPFNLTADQFVARVLEGPLAQSPMLANLHVIVVGAELTRQHPRAVSLRTLDAAIRLVKFGEIESAPMPRPVAPTTVAARSAEPTLGAIAAIDAPVGGSISGGIISRIWDAADASATNAAAAPVTSVEQVRPAQPTAPATGLDAPAPASAPVTGGGAPASRLFAAPPAAAPVPTAPILPRSSPIQGGGAAQAAPLAHVVAPMVEDVAPAHGLQPVLPYRLPNGAGYRGPAMRRGQLPAASHVGTVNAPQSSPQPVPPALASQVQSVVYAGPPSRDPLLSWSAGGTAAPVVAPLPTGAAQQMPQQVALQPMAAPAPARTLPMEPPAGVYGGMPAGLVAADPMPHLQADPFLQRAERDGGATYG